MVAILRVVAKKGLGRFAERMGYRADSKEASDDQPRSDAVRLREAMEELGPTFIKFGQMLSQREDIFPSAFVAELGGLHDRATTFPAAEARRIIEEDVGQSVDDLFTSFDDKPMAAASMAQVHCAMLPDGTHVIVKVQRPGIDTTVEGDIAVLRRVAKLVSSAMPSMRSFNLPQLVDEFAVTLRGELDFQTEARNLERFAHANEKDPLVFVPKVFPEASSRRVLTMEHSTGHRIDEDRAAAQPRLAAELMRLFLTGVFEHGVFHADPHPGNIFLLPDGRICFHDFGALGLLSPVLQEKLRELFLAVMARDAGWLASVYLGMGGAAAGDLNRAAFTTDLGVSLDRYYNASELGSQSFSTILREFVSLGRKHHIRLPGEVTMLVRAFAELESLVRKLDPQFSSLMAFQRYSGRLLKHALLPDMTIGRMAEAYRVVSAVREVAEDAPVTLRRLMGRLERGEPLFDIRHQSGASLERHLLRASNRLAFALIIAATVMGSAILLAAHAGPHWEGLPLLGIAGFVIAGLLGIAWAIITLRSGKL